MSLDQKPRSSLRLGFLSASDPESRTAWSGTQHYMYKALCEEFVQVIPLGPVSLYGAIEAGKVLDRVMRKTVGLGYNFRHNRYCSLMFARSFSQRLDRCPCDVIFAPAGGVEIASLKTDIPICYLSDTSFGQLSEYYARYSNMASWAKAEGNRIEAEALTRSKVVVYPSNWAADYVAEHYQVPRSKIEILPFGANIDDTPSRQSVLPKKIPHQWNILFLGVSWERKGGQIALDAIKHLNQIGIDATLHVCGCIPPITHPKMKVIPYLNKNHPEDYRRFVDLIRESHFLLVPTRADAYGIVFCEASAYAIPSFTTATGGTTAAVTNGINGFALPYEAGGELYAARIADLINNPEQYLKLCISARDHFEAVLNWRSWGRQMRRILESTFTTA
jgi:glycosyltransferase involved in cell wall biosynthesis